MTVDLNSIGVGIAGTGFMGPTHVEALRRIGIQPIGIVGSSLQSSEKAAAQLHLNQAYPSFEAMLNDERIDVVHIGVPNYLHFEMTKAAIAAGKHVMCEKPLAMNSKETSELVKLSAKSGLVCGVNYNLRFYPLCQEAIELVRRGDLGNVIYATGGYCQDWLLKPTDFNWRVLREHGGPLRAIADIGTHWLDLIQSIIGQKVVSVCADLTTVHSQRLRPPVGSVQTFQYEPMKTSDWEKVSIDTEDLGHLLLKFEDGVRGNLIVSQVSAGRKNHLHFEIGGTQSSIAWNAETPNRMWIGFRDQPNKILQKDPSLMSSRASRFSSYPSGHAEGYPDTFKQCFRGFYEYILSDRSEAPSFPTFQDGHDEVLLCEAILLSHEQQRWVDIKGE